MKFCVVVPNLFIYISGRRSCGLNTNANHMRFSVLLLPFNILQRIKIVNKIGGINYFFQTMFSSKIKFFIWKVEPKIFIFVIWFSPYSSFSSFFFCLYFSVFLLSVFFIFSMFSSRLSLTKKTLILSKYHSNMTLI